MRLFVAVRLPDHVVATAEEALARVRPDYPELRWVPPERWHLTLAFFGDTAERDVPALRQRMSRRVSRSQVVDLRLAGAGRFDGRVLWLGVDGDAAALSALARSIAYDQRPYRPHITVARTRAPTDLRPVVQRLQDYVGPHWQATAVELIESHLGPKPSYSTVEAWPLPARREDASDR